MWGLPKIIANTCRRLARIKSPLQQNTFVYNECDEQDEQDEQLATKINLNKKQSNVHVWPSIFIASNC